MRWINLVKKITVNIISFIVKTVKKISNFFICFFKGIIRLIKSMGTPKGIISLIISFSIVVGWALVFIGIGFVTHNMWYKGIGLSVVAFWANPILSPMWLSIISLGYIFQRFIFRDKKVLTLKELFRIFFGRDIEFKFRFRLRLKKKQTN